MNCLLATLIVFTLITNPIDAKDKCNDDCSTKTYCLSPSGSAECSKNNLVSATWSVIEVSSFYDTIGLTLVAGNVNPSEERAISLVFKSQIHSTSLTNYTCFKSATGQSTIVSQESSSEVKVIKKGDSRYAGGVLTCTWSFNINNDIWPLYNEHPAFLINDPQGIIELHSGSQSAIVARDVGDLPIYHLQYLKCCNNVHGNGDYLILFNQTKDDYYLMRPLKLRPGELTLSMNMSAGLQLIFTCDFINQQINGFVLKGDKKTPINNRIYGQFINIASNPQCYWSHPWTIMGSFGAINTVGRAFDMQIISDGEVVYSEKEVTFKENAIDNISSSPKLLPFTSILIMIISLILNCSL